MNLKNLKPESSFRAIFVGHSKSGKTVAAASFPSPVSIEDFDGRIQGIQGASWLSEKVQNGEIEYESYRGNTYNKWVERLNTLQMLAAQRSPAFPKTEVVDSLTAQALGMLLEAVPDTHKDGKGKRIGTLMMPGPEDFGAESNGVQGSLNLLRQLPIQNLIVSTHLVPVWQKQDPSNPMSPQVEVGEKFSLRDKLAVNIGIFFDHVFVFRRKMESGRIKFTVEFSGQLASNSYGLPTGVFDITGRNFYEFLQEKIKENQPK